MVKPKLLIGTVAVMLLMIVLSVAVLSEPNRMLQVQERIAAQRIEEGAKIYQSHCQDCHGVEASAQQCFNQSGTQIACQGLPLKNQRLVCGERPERLDDMGWEGSKEAFINSTTTAGYYCFFDGAIDWDRRTQRAMLLQLAG
ncbi:MAG: cytochrome c [Chloroflexota bacterium]